MNFRRISWGVMTALLAWALTAGATETTLALFGVPLKGATRDQMRQTFKQGGLRAKREQPQFWYDTYDATGVLDGATDFEAGYLLSTNRFAHARYTFPAFMDTSLVGNVIDRVSSKYGRPTTLKGSYNLGEVLAHWNLPQGMQIEVYRGWPDTTVFLEYFDLATYRELKAEMAAENRANEQQKTKAQSSAF